MSKYVIRHALSQANNRHNIGTLAFAAEDAPLMVEGWEQADAAAGILRRDHGIDPKDTPVAVSRLLRTQETAAIMGFPLPPTAYPSLNEVEHGMGGTDLRRMLDLGELPPAALRAAEAILRRPPSERVWVTHGLVIAGLCQVLGVSDHFERLIPRFCEIRKLPVQ